MTHFFDSYCAQGAQPQFDIGREDPDSDKAAADCVMKFMPRPGVGGDSASRRAAGTVSQFAEEIEAFLAVINQEQEPKVLRLDEAKTAMGKTQGAVRVAKQVAKLSQEHFIVDYQLYKNQFSKISQGRIDATRATKTVDTKITQK
ncbi:hypothetical protein XA68_11025 [Ophiocordyceps unilateralis]|uniref:Uncharacterized protein n=1 Tax=Ophiocordyceps unilateralis TaxID=268505 RepID=A0A2A9PHN8_OPHUN|nr:hypothetical protein XA68_11025 [Ophiocordyceps unilateralis]